VLANPGAAGSEPDLICLSGRGDKDLAEVLELIAPDGLRPRTPA
jgi:hypothetical protein